MQDNSNTPPFAIGQKVIALIDCDMVFSLYKKGEIFEVVGLEYCCEVSGWRIALGGKSLNGDVARCLKCRKWIYSDAIFPSKNFAPIETQYADMTKEIASSVKETSEVPDKILIPETAN